MTTFWPATYGNSVPCTVKRTRVTVVRGLKAIPRACMLSTGAAGSSWAAAGAAAATTTNRGRNGGALRISGREPNLRSGGGRRPGEALHGEQDGGHAGERADDEHGDLPPPVLGRPEGDRVVDRVQRDARIQRARLPVHDAQQEAEEGERDEEGDRPVRIEMDRTEEQAGHGRGPERAGPVAQGREDEAAEQELLGERREDAHDEHRGDQQRRVAVDAEVVERLVLGGLVEQLEPQPGEHE